METTTGVFVNRTFYASIFLRDLMSEWLPISEGLAGYDLQMRKSVSTMISGAVLECSQSCRTSLLAVTWR